MGSPNSIVYVTDGVSPWVVGGMQAVSRRHISWLSEAGYRVTVVACCAGMPVAVDFCQPSRSLTSAHAPGACKAGSLELRASAKGL